jgi:hypothetical protein
MIHHPSLVAVASIGRPSRTQAEIKQSLDLHRLTNPSRFPSIPMREPFSEIPKKACVSKPHADYQIGASFQFLLITHMPGRNYLHVKELGHPRTLGSTDSFLNNCLPEMQQGSCWS